MATTPGQWHDKHGRQGATPHKPYQTERRVKPYPARIGSKPKCCRSDGKKARPFQLGRNSTHHAMSTRAAAGRLMRCTKAGTIIDKSISRRRKMRPGQTTLHTKRSTPIRDSSSSVVHYCRVRHAGRQSRSRASLSGGRRISRREESRVMPRNWRQRVGRTSFSDARGTPRSCQRSWKACRLRAHAAWVPRTRK